MSADFKIDKNMQEMTALLKALDTSIENGSALALTILVGTSFLCVDLLESRDSISLKIVSGETRSNENVYYHYQSLLNHLYAISTGSLIFETSHNKSSLILVLRSLITMLKKVLNFSAISMSKEMMLLLSASVRFTLQSLFQRKAG